MGGVVHTVVVAVAAPGVPVSVCAALTVFVGVVVSAMAFVSPVVPMPAVVSTVFSGKEVMAVLMIAVMPVITMVAVIGIPVVGAGDPVITAVGIDHR
jgi:hypothetical protein